MFTNNFAQKHSFYSNVTSCPATLINDILYKKNCNSNGVYHSFSFIHTLLISVAKTIKEKCHIVEYFHDSLGFFHSCTYEKQENNMICEFVRE